MYKELGLKEKLPDMKEQDQLELLATNGMLVKRPIIVNKETILIGFKQEDWEDKLAKYD